MNSLRVDRMHIFVWRIGTVIWGYCRPFTVMAVVSPTVAKKLVDSLQTDLRTLSADCRRKYPPVKEVRLTDVTRLTPCCGCVSDYAATTTTSWLIINFQSWLFSLFQAKKYMTLILNEIFVISHKIILLCLLMYVKKRIKPGKLSTSCSSR